MLVFDDVIQRLVLSDESQPESGKPDRKARWTKLKKRRSTLIRSIKNDFCWAYFSHGEFFHLVMIHTTNLRLVQVAIFSGGSGISVRWGHQHTILRNFPKNCMKLKEFGRGVGACTSLAPRFKSFNDFWFLTT